MSFNTQGSGLTGPRLIRFPVTLQLLRCVQSGCYAITRPFPCQGKETRSPRYLPAGFPSRQKGRARSRRLARLNSYRLPANSRARRRRCSSDTYYKDSCPYLSRARMGSGNMRQEGFRSSPACRSPVPSGECRSQWWHLSEHPTRQGAGMFPLADDRDPVDNDKWNARGVRVG